MKKRNLPRIPWYGYLLAIIVLGTLLFLFLATNVLGAKPEFGVTYSVVYAEELGLDPVGAYETILKDLDVKLIRLPVYWTRIQPIEGGQSKWEELDRLIALSEEHGAELTLAIGQKVPRWPECHFPEWVLSKSEHERYRALLSYLTEVVTRYRDSEAIVRWQVENEPLFPFGVCPNVNTDYLLQEVKTVRALDDRPIQMTVSGELEPWAALMGESDILGVSMYRVTWNDVYGYFIYPFTPTFYRLRAWAAELFVDDVIISELQAEPWFYESIENKAPKEWYSVFTKEMMQNNIEFAEETGLDEVYLWGVEWWYYLSIHGTDDLWKYALTIF